MLSAPLNDHRQEGSRAINSNTSRNFCQDCGLTFESITSLEVHLSYHKENLLSRWASENKNISISSSEMDIVSKAPTPTSTYQSSSSLNDHHQLIKIEQSPIHNMNNLNSDEHKIYLSMQYNNNTGDPNIRNPSPRFMHSPAYSPVELQNMYHNRYHSSPSPHFLNHASDPEPTDKIGGRISLLGSENYFKVLERQSTDAAAEILDLDSHKVHVYQHLHEQPPPPREQPPPPQTTQFYRPFLNGNLPTIHDSHLNNWGLDAITPQVLTSEKPFLPSPFSMDPQRTLPMMYSQPSLHLNTTTAFTIDASNPISSTKESAPVQQPLEFVGQPANETFQNNFPSTLPKLETLQAENQVMNSPTTSSPKLPTNPKSSKKVSSTTNGENSTAKPKGGGMECRRPKTYNCTACNKWFTSSGHLKRHYGTTLHKNSIRQNGDLSQEPPPPKQKKSMTKKAGAAQQKKSEQIQQMSTRDVEGGFGSNSTPSPINNLINNSSIKTESASSNNSVFSFSGGNGNEELIKVTAHDVPAPSMTSTRPLINTFANIPQNIQGSQQLPQPQFSTSGLKFSSAGISHPAPVHPFAQTHNYSSDSALAFSTMALPNAYPISTSLIPTSMYGTGYSAINGNGAEISLPPFSSVGYSHYDSSGFSHLNSTSRALYPPIPGNSTANENPSPSTNNKAGVDRISPPCQMILPDNGSGYLMSPGHESNTNNRHFNQEQGSPEVARSASIISDSIDNDSHSDSSSREMSSSGGELGEPMKFLLLTSF